MSAGQGVTFGESPGQPTQESHTGDDADDLFIRLGHFTPVFVSLNVFSLRPGEDNLVYGEFVQLVRHLSVPSAGVPPHEFPVWTFREWQPLPSLPPGPGQSERRSSSRRDGHGSAPSQHQCSFSQAEASEPRPDEESQEDVEIPHRCFVQPAEW